MQFREPLAQEIRSRLESTHLEFSYPEVGTTREIGITRPAGLNSRYDFDHYRFDLGRGVDLFVNATAALRDWKHLAIPWLTFHGIDEPVREGANVASLVPLLGFWFLNPCRIVYADFESKQANGFGYGTLTGHAACGEERFRVRFDPATERVHYEITAFSRPALAVVRLAYPLARRVQRKFAATSAAALREAIA